MSVRQKHHVDLQVFNSNGRFNKALRAYPLRRRASATPDRIGQEEQAVSLVQASSMPDPCGMGLCRACALGTIHGGCFN
eukprot:CAMPEP_0184974726 /NCGR_PEP_ID=MMETSP1098-20130426/6130_1 /TAXON_ID=89044 /ORGANISM="Spumella elongata, Strain CCAP 955/1" /LENGTH=78 /DNA_ID=CAMNT_0027497345 /DNA_START=138 /DNA_END=374 /DNA_ORIENTATION=-